MLHLYRRHKKHCPHRPKGREHLRCPCPLWVDGRMNAERIHKALGTTDWQKAQQIVREMETGAMELNGGVLPSRETVKGPITIEKAKELFFVNLDVRNLASETKRKHETLWSQCQAFAKEARLDFVRDLDATAIDEFVETWEDEALSRGKKLERFRQFFKFAVSRKWIEEDPTAGMRGPKVKEKQTPPFTPNEMAKILAEVERRIHAARYLGQKANAIRAKALILFLRFSGLRIGDAVGYQIEWVKDGRVRLFTRKNNRHVDVELPGQVIAALAAVPAESHLYWFWTGKSKIESATTKWQNQLLLIFKAAGIQGGHPHRFRDTFAVGMLENGKTLQEVADALGNTLEVTERHYNPWSKTRQKKLDEAVRASWKNDPLLKILDDREKLSKAKAPARVM